MRHIFNRTYHTATAFLTDRRSGGRAHSAIQNNSADAENADGFGSSGGSALVEFAIAFPFQLFLTFGLIQLMLLLVSSLVVNYASFRCCRAALTYYEPGDATATAQSIKPVAQVILAPLSVANHANTDVPSGWPSDSVSTAITIPGWGEVRGTAGNINKIKLTVQEDSGVITTRLSYLQELLFPFIDRIFALAASGSSDEGRNFAGASESNGGIWVSANGRVHYIITREHTMRRDSVIEDVAPGSAVYEYKCTGW